MYAGAATKGMRPASPRPSAGAGEWRKPIIAEKIEGGGTTTGPLDCSGADFSFLVGDGARTIGAAAATGEGSSGLTFSGEDFAG